MPAFKRKSGRDAKIGAFRALCLNLLCPVPVPVPVPEKKQAGEAGRRLGGMELDHERLDVYHLALDFLVLASDIIGGLPRGRSHLADQFSRASLSIVLNLAEGAGKRSKADKRRYYLTARGSATESAALLDVCRRLNLLEETGHRTGKAMVVRMVSMLIKLAQSCEN
jgi:four helix bundle protein